MELQALWIVGAIISASIVAVLLVARLVRAWQRRRRADRLAMSLVLGVAGPLKELEPREPDS